eukprot:scaffold84315_cov33-Phaeocystis_antarctica.AAC.1
MPRPASRLVAQVPTDVGDTAWPKVLPFWQCPSSAPAPPQGAPGGGSGQPGTPLVSSSDCLGRASEPPSKSLRLAVQATEAWAPMRPVG